MKRALVVALLSLALGGTAAAEDLLTVFQDALQNDPAIREADANRRAAREARPQAWANLLPQISASASRQESRTDGFFERPQELRDTGQILLLRSEGEEEPTTKRWSVDLRQRVFSWADWMTLRRSAHEVAQAEADYQAAQQDLIVRVAERYFDVLAARDAVEAEQAALEAISRQLEQAEKRFEVGLIAITDVQEARAARDSASAAVIAAKRRLATAEELLREITNRQYETLARPGEDLPLTPPNPADPERWVEVSMNQNLALISSRLAADIARENVRVAFGGHLPTIDLVAGRTHLEQDSAQTFEASPPVRPDPVTVPYSQESDDKSISLQINIPIFSGGGTQSRVRQSQYRWIAARERVVRVSRETERAARDAYLGVLSEIARVNALRQALESSQTALKATEAGYEVGTRTAVDVLVARRQLVQAQTDYLRSRYDYILNVIRLRLAAGDLTPETVAEINAWLRETVPTRPATTTP
ncbi:MAG: TolC family outer membrane protein [Pseudomonadota bacterium]|nr:MAG: type I secretion protein TolC [Pseudomonadota bacterium]